MIGRFAAAVLLTGLFTLAPADAGPAPKDTAHYVAGTAVCCVQRTLPNATRVGVGGFNFPARAGLRAATITVADASTVKQSIGVIVCGTSCTGAGGFQRGFCTNAGGVIDLRKIPLKPGQELSVRVSAVQPSGLWANTPGCDAVGTTGTISVTYCVNRKGVQFC